MHHAFESRIPLPLRGGSVTAAGAVVALQSPGTRRAIMMAGGATRRGHASTRAVAHMLVLFLRGHCDVLECGMRREGESANSL
jgi:hypothetical protein